MKVTLDKLLELHGLSLGLNSQYEWSNNWRKHRPIRRVSLFRAAKDKYEKGVLHITNYNGWGFATWEEGPSDSFGNTSKYIDSDGNEYIKEERFKLLVKK